jgi:hypothetical protein
LRLDQEKQAQLSQLESDIGKTMFSNGLKDVSDIDLGAGDKSIYYQGCGSQFGCGD